MEGVCGGCVWRVMCVEGNVWEGNVCGGCVEGDVCGGCVWRVVCVEGVWRVMCVEGGVCECMEGLCGGCVCGCDCVWSGCVLKVNTWIPMVNVCGMWR